MKSPDTHVVLVRSLTTGRWQILEYAKSAKSALAKARKQTGLSYGDLILALDIAEISAIPERGKCLYLVNSSGIIKQAPKPPNEPTWFLEWEGSEAKADDMLRLCKNIDHKLLVTTACAIARLALPYVQAGEHRPRIAIEMAEAWTRGEVTIEQAKKARDDADAADAAVSSADAAVVSVGVAVSSAHASYADAAVSSAAAHASYAAYYTASAMSGDYKDNLRQLSHIVREHIPLHVVLESLT